jgi:hypothetical protein
MGRSFVYLTEVGVDLLLTSADSVACLKGLGVNEYSIYVSCLWCHNYCQVPTTGACTIKLFTAIIVAIL